MDNLELLGRASAAIAVVTSVAVFVLLLRKELRSCETEREKRFVAAYVILSNAILFAILGLMIVADRNAWVILLLLYLNARAFDLVRGSIRREKRTA